MSLLLLHKRRPAGWPALPALPYGFALRPQGIAALANDDPAPTWPDAGPFAFHATQATAGKRPLKRTATNNGKTFPYLDFDGVDDTLDISPTEAIHQVCAAIYSPLAAWNNYGSFFETGDAGRWRVGNTMENNATRFHLNPPPTSVRSNGTALDNPFDLAPLQRWQIITVNLANPGNAIGLCAIGNLQASYYLRFYLAGLLGFTEVLAGAALSQAESYLAAICGVTLD